MATNFAIDKIKSAVPSPVNKSPGVPASSTASTPEAAQPSAVSGFRSLTYSVAVYLFAAGSNVWPLIVLQGVVVVWMLMMVAKVSGVRTTVWTAGSGLLVIAIGSTLPAFLTLASPDIFSGVLILATGLLVWFKDRLNRGEQLLILLIAAIAITAHSSHAALAGIVILTGAVLTIVRAVRPHWRGGQLGNWGQPMAAMILGLAVNATLGVVGFGEASVAPKRYPFALARSISDGPAYWYLKAECPHQSWSICEIYRDHSIPRGNFDILWGANGIVERATPEQMDRVRDEELMIVRASVWRYPRAQIEATLRNIGEQISMIGIDPSVFRQTYLNPDGSLAYRSAPVRPALPMLIALQQLVVGMSLAIILLGIWLGSARLRGLALTVIFLIFANDVICAGISAPEMRYQNRVLWLLPLVCLLMLLNWRKHDKTAVEQDV